MTYRIYVQPHTYPNDGLFGYRVHLDLRVKFPLVAMGHAMDEMQAFEQARAAAQRHAAHPTKTEEYHVQT